jgi:hypothetical protein
LNRQLLKGNSGKPLGGSLILIIGIFLFPVPFEIKNKNEWKDAYQSQSTPTLAFAAEESRKYI